MSEWTRRIQVTEAEIDQAVTAVSRHIEMLIVTAQNAATGRELHYAYEVCETAINLLGKLWANSEERLDMQSYCRDYADEMKQAYALKVLRLVSPALRAQHSGRPGITRPAVFIQPAVDGIAE